MSGTTVRQVLRITGMHCPSCATAIDLDLEDLPGVVEASTSFARGTTVVAFDPAQVDLATLVAAVREAGYTAEPLPEARGGQLDRASQR